MVYKRRLKLSVSDVPLREAFALSPLERTIFLELMDLLRKSPLSTSEIEEKFGSSALNVLTKIKDAGMIEKESYRGKWKLSGKFSRILKRWAREWEETIRG